jgi:cytidyltransferase-like protein
MPSSSPKIVMAFGTFDYFHAGHENYLKQAKAMGETLIVVIARDETAKRVKNRKPDFSEKKRLRDVMACKHVDKVVLGGSDDKYKIIKRFKPQILALGYDQFVFTYGLEQFFIKEKLDIKIVRTLAFKPGTFKSSLIKNATKTPCAQESLSASKG